MLLALAPRSWMDVQPYTDPLRRAVGWPAGISYSVFVIHFAVSLAVSAVVTHWQPQVLGWNAAGMLASVALSLLAGAVVHRWTERRRPTWRRWLMWVAVFAASAMLATQV